MKSMKRAASLVLVLSLVLCLFAACGSGNNVSQNNGSKDQTEPEKVEKVTLTFLNDQVEAVEGGAAIAFDNALDRLTKEHPEITIDQEKVADEAEYTKVKTLAAGNELPDMFVARGDLLDMLVSSDLIGSIDEELNADPAWKDQFLPGAFDVFTRDEKIYAVPCTLKSTSLVFYNEDIFKDVGITQYPQTWSEFLDAVDKIKAKGYIPITLGNKEQWMAQSCILSELADRFTGTDWFNSIKDRKGAKFTDPDFVKSLQAMADLSARGAFNSDMNSLDNMQQRTAYYNKKAAMMIEGAWAIGDMDKDCPADVLSATKVALIPAVEGGKGDPAAMSGGASVGFFMSNLTGAKRDAAILVLKALSSPEFGTEMTEFNKFPAVKPGDYDESKVSDLAKQYNDLVDKGSFVPVYDIQLTPAVIDVINTGLQQLLIGGTSPEELAQRIEAEYESEAN